MIEKQFAIEDIRELATDNSDDMAYCKIWALSSGNNSHKNPISVEVLKEYAHTILGKWIIADYSTWQEDFTTHTSKQVIVGIIPKDSEITFEEKDGKTFLVVEAVMSKLYAKNSYLAFVEDNQRSVSCEFLCEEDNEDENGDKAIKSFDIKAVTILGKAVNPSCAGAEMTITKFSEHDADRFYKEHSSSITKFAEGRRGTLLDSEGAKSKVEKSYDKFKLGEEDGEKKMDEVKEFEEAEVVEDEKVEDEKTEAIEEFAEEEEKTEEVEEESTEKEFSLDANLDVAGILAMLENETEDYRALATELFEEEDKNIIMAKTLAMYKEMSELKQYKEAKEVEIAKMAEEAEIAKTMAEVEKIMEEVKDDLEEKDFADLKEEGMACKLEQISQFANKVKAFAYEASKGKEKTEKPADEIMKFGFDFNAYGTKKATSAEDIFNKYK